MLGACRAMRETQELQSTPISIDTFDAEVAAQAVAAGAHMVNDVSGGLMDPNMHAQVQHSLFCCYFAVPGSHLTWQAVSRLHVGCADIACRLPTSSTRHGHALILDDCTPLSCLSRRRQLALAWLSSY